jgi:hypothetical protein
MAYKSSRPTGNCATIKAGSDAGLKLHIASERDRGELLGDLEGCLARLGVT